MKREEREILRGIWGWWDESEYEEKKRNLKMVESWELRQIWIQREGKMKGEREIEKHKILKSPAHDKRKSRPRWKYEILCI